MTYRIKSIIAHKFRSFLNFWNSALVPPSPHPPPPLPLDNSGFTPPYFPLFPPTTYILPLPINPPPPILQDRNFLIHAFPHNGTLLKQHYIRHSPIGSWNPESTLSLYSSFRLTISGKKKKKKIVKCNAHFA